MPCNMGLHGVREIVRASITIRVAQDDHIARLTPHDVDIPVVRDLKHARLPRPSAKTLTEKPAGTLNALRLDRRRAELFGLHDMTDDFHTGSPVSEG